MRNSVRPGLFVAVMALSVAGSTLAAERIAQVPGQTGLQVEVARWVPDRDPDYGWWGVTWPDGDPAQPLLQTATDDFLAVAPGRYDVWWVQDYATKDWPMLLAEDLVVVNGQTTVLQADTGIRLDIADWVPDRDDSYGWWGASVAGDGPDDRLIWSSEEESLLLPPGSYDIWWVQDYDRRDKPLLLAANVAVEPGQRATVGADSGILIDVANWVPDRDDSYGWWGAVPTGADVDERVNWTNQHDRLLLPPGKYDVYWVQDYETRDSPLLMAKLVPVGPGQAVELAIGSGIRIDVAGWVPERDESYGWWGVSPAGEPADKRIAWTTKTDALLVPPGSYDLWWVQDYATRDNPLPLAQGVEVAAGEPTTVAIDAGIRLQTADWVPERDENYGWWGASPAGAGPEARLGWTVANDAVLVPPGRYDVWWVQDYATRDLPIRLAADVAVEPGALVELAATTGIAVTLPVEVPPITDSYGWWGVAPVGGTAEETIARSPGRSDVPLLVPAGTYDLYWRQNYDAVAEIWKSGIAVPEGELVLVGLDAVPMPGDDDQVVQAPTDDDDTAAALDRLRGAGLLNPLDRHMGDPRAPVMVVEYGSLTCPHCASFHLNSLPPLITEYVDTGKVFFVFRDFPADRDGLVAGMIAHCSGADRYFEVLEDLFKRQHEWSAAADPQATLRTLAAGYGIAEGGFEKCVMNVDIQNGLIARAQAGLERGVTGTPYFLINGEGIAGNRPIEDLREIIDPLVAATTPVP